MSGLDDLTREQSLLTLDTAGRRIFRSAPQTFTTARCVLGENRLRQLFSGALPHKDSVRQFVEDRVSNRGIKNVRETDAHFFFLCKPDGLTRNGRAVAAREHETQLVSPRHVLFCI
ncbi:MAG: hypothetical protein COS85_19840 [Armatimonadetes bacterium CG07_land_8_20_14_0_80_59_28]|nr:MAG: hypothetical protein COS85_19840 [Armatimonadetes bacterium CG07_land_8_20_14_0_80_59_28]PIX43413.1 MAG: hypothetical protein COZ56_07180 [Armatimonadetes bacterium CG_4_8_14_3_um_filter_58_9]PIY43043.1 MAG: hypothetical protein COZ05_12360 [Armatimonadetes bacterium CG_4_10_14_3_um_filter_59_10]